MSSSKAAKTVRLCRDEATAAVGQTNWARMDAATDDAISAWLSEEAHSSD